jgi:predicted enzyme related to lactoylglutathione lyase
MTAPYRAEAQRFYVREDSAYRRPSDLHGKRIGVRASCSVEAYLKGELELPGVRLTRKLERPKLVCGRGTEHVQASRAPSPGGPTGRGFSDYLLRSSHLDRARRARARRPVLGRHRAGRADTAATFYAGVFGWEVEKGTPPGTDTRYYMCRLRGSEVAAIGSPPPAGMPPTWTTYVWVDDADGVAASAVKAGGRLLVEPWGGLDGGRMAIVADRSGAVFGVWTPGANRGAQRINEPSVNKHLAKARARVRLARLSDIGREHRRHRN